MKYADNEDYEIKTNVRLAECRQTNTGECLEVAPQGGVVHVNQRRIVNLEIPFSNAHIALARRTVAELAKSMSFSQSQVEDITVAVGEACTNAVKHGCKTEAMPLIHVKCILKNNEMSVRITNHKISDRSLCVPSKPNLSNENGYGLFLMSRLMDRVKIENTGNTACVMMTKRLN